MVCMLAQRVIAVEAGQLTGVRAMMTCVLVPPPSFSFAKSSQVQ